MIKTTIYLEPHIADALRRLASEQQRSEADLIREALASYTREPPRPKPKGGGGFRSGRSDVSKRVEELLQDAVKEGRWP